MTKWKLLLISWMATNICLGFVVLLIAGPKADGIPSEVYFSRTRGGMLTGTPYLAPEQDLTQQLDANIFRMKCNIKELEFLVKQQSHGDN